jgi:hypothetical protein
VEGNLVEYVHSWPLPLSPLGTILAIFAGYQPCDGSIAWISLRCLSMPPRRLGFDLAH